MPRKGSSNPWCAEVPSPRWNWLTYLAPRVARRRDDWKPCSFSAAVRPPTGPNEAISDIFEGRNLLTPPIFEVRDGEGEIPKGEVAACRSGTGESTLGRVEKYESSFRFVSQPEALKPWQLGGRETNPTKR
mmetsp:Transcript_45198/g.98343  ORF Transcript_45198/g.98343 Transcript_45198/m.98343 type:complete len:131 (-) Transcript_45198:84-476(-)